MPIHLMGPICLAQIFLNLAFEDKVDRMSNRSITLFAFDEQCDQLDGLFLNIWPFTTMVTC